MPVQVKICGINTPQAADAALRAGADFGGLTFFAKSPRAVAIEAAAQLAERMRGRIKLAAVVVDADDGLLARIANEVKPDYFQLHGQESPARAAEISARFGPVIKALSVAVPEDLAKADAYQDIAEMFLFDAPAIAGASRPGGHGVAFDWQMMKSRKLGKPWFLAGGLKPENVARAIDLSGAGMVDVSSGVESAPGVKSESLIQAFIAGAKGTVKA